MENEKKMDTYKEEMNKEISTLRTQIQNQTLKMDDMKLRLEMIGIHVPADVTKRKSSVRISYQKKHKEYHPISNTLEAFCLR